MANLGRFRNLRIGQGVPSEDMLPYGSTGLEQLYGTELHTREGIFVAINGMNIMLQDNLYRTERL